MKSIKNLFAAALASAMALSLAACGGSAPAPASGAAPAPASSAPASGAAGSEAAPAPGKVYIIASDTTFAPFEFEDIATGKRIGIDMDLLAAVAEDQGFQFEVQALGFDAALTALESNQADGMIAGMSITDDRRLKFDFSDPYFDSGVVMGIAADNEEIKGYEGLKGKKVAVKNGTEGAAFAESIKAQYGFETVSFPESANMYEDVKAGNSAACFEDYPVMGYAVSKGVGLKIVTDLEKGNSYGFAVNKGQNPELLEMFNAGLKNVRDSGKYQEILDTYIQK